MDKNLKNQNEIKNLLKEAHDKMDDLNAQIVDHTYLCHFCHVDQYGIYGIIHTQDCILTKIRATGVVK